MDREQITLFDSYDDFVEKFKPKKTTDDCYTPPEVYEAVRAWCVDRFGLQGRKIVRPFYPGGDYERAEYPAACVVLDNPPFSIISRIEEFYLRNEIDFFLFAPGLTLFRADPRLNYVVCDLSVRYENGAEVPTSFVTNLGDVRMQTAPTLTAQIKGIQKQNKQKPKYQYPAHVMTASKLRYIDGKGISLEIGGRIEPIAKLDGQNGKTIFGRGFLLSDSAAAQAAAAQAEEIGIWTLSAREQAIIEILSR